MKRHAHSPWLVAVLAMGLLGFVLPAQVAASPSGSKAHRSLDRVSKLASVEYIYHGLSVQPPNKPKTQGKRNMSLYNQYFLQTQKTQKASIRFKDGTTLHMNQMTDALLSTPHVTVVKKGTVDEVLSPGTNHKVQTATAVAAAVGTNFLVQIVGKGKHRGTRFIVVHGAVQVKNKKGTVVVTTNHASVVLPNQAPQPPQPYPAQQAAGWTNGMPPGPTDENVALAADGGQVVGFSSQYQVQTQGNFWSATYVNDGTLDYGWATAPGQTTNQWVKILLAGNKVQKITKVVIDPAATHGDDPSSDLKDFEIRVSTTTSDDSAFTKVDIPNATCKQENKLQTFVLPTPVDAKYIELYALDNYGSPDWISVAEFEAISPGT